MSFTQMKRDDLYELATENFAVDVEQTATKNQIIAALAENGVTWEMAKTFDENARALAEEQGEEEPQPAPGVITADAVKGAATLTLSDTPVETVEYTEMAQPVVAAPAPVEPEVVLVKMERENPRYDIRGYKFTRKDPFALVKEDDADYILSNVEGFKVASPREAKEYYG